jgi:hypothetical protein
MKLPGWRLPRQPDLRQRGRSLGHDSLHPGIDKVVGAGISHMLSAGEEAVSMVSTSAFAQQPSGLQLTALPLPTHAQTAS